MVSIKQECVKFCHVTRLHYKMIGGEKGGLVKNSAAEVFSRLSKVLALIPSSEEEGREEEEKQKEELRGRNRNKK